MKFILMTDDYSPLKKGHSYCISKEGHDWVQIKYDGKPLVISKNIIHDDPISTLFEYNLSEECDQHQKTFNTIFI
tara:strand:+ start:3626 stop:3850 length:225 start_codon:yes stop_codon:yes gene_type:complete